MQSGSGPVHVVLNNIELELFGQGMWCVANHGRLRRRWLKLHLSVDASTGEIAAFVLTDGNKYEAAQVPALTRQPEGSIASLTADSAYNCDPVYQAAAARQPGSPIEVVVPLMAEWGRIGWQRAAGYMKRNHAETTMGRYKPMIGLKLCARSRSAQLSKVALAVSVLNHRIREAKLISVRR